MISDSSAMEQAAQARPGSTRAFQLIAIGLFICTLGVSIGRELGRAAQPFIGPHAFVSADVATTARTFAREGILQLHAIPVNNNPPIGPQDAYTHWPPLLPALLSIVFRGFGSSERVAHCFMLVVLVTTALLIFRVGTKLLGLAGGALAGYFWLTLPVVLQFGDIVAQQALCMLFVLGACAALPKRPRLAAVLLFLAVISSWEAVLIAPVLWLVSLPLSSLRHLARLALITTAVGVGSVAALYLLGNVRVSVDTLSAAKFYMGLSQNYSHLQIVGGKPELRVSEQFRLTFLNNVLMLGPIGLAAFILLLFEHAHRILTVLLPLSAPWIIWCIVMHNHTARHHFEFLIGAPAIALALGWLATNQETKHAWRALVLAALAALQLAILPKPYIADGYDPKRLLQFGLDVRSLTSPGSVVLSPLVSAVPLYYSERHFIRGIASVGDAQSELPVAHTEFPNAPIYLAVPPALRSDFASMPNVTGVSESPDAIVMKLAPGGVQH